MGTGTPLKDSASIYSMLIIMVSHSTGLMQSQAVVRWALTKANDWLVEVKMEI